MKSNILLPLFQMADPLQQLQNVLETCCIGPAASHAQLINNKGLTSIADLGLLDGDNDVLKMAKHMAAWTEANRCVNLGMVAIKKLQVLVFWIKDHQMRSLDLDPVNWNPISMAATMEAKCIHKEMKDSKKAPSMKDIMKFNPDRYKLCEDAFLNVLSQTIGASSEPLRYVVCDKMPPEELQNDDEERMYQLPHEGKGYNKDNQTVYLKLKEYLIDTNGYTWISDYNRSDNGRAAFQAWSNHDKRPSQTGQAYQAHEGRAPAAVLQKWEVYVIQIVLWKNQILLPCD